MSSEKSSPERSRIAEFYKLSIEERAARLAERHYLSNDEMRGLLNGRFTLSPSDANKMIENVVGVFGLPLGLGLNFVVNGKPYVVPMVVEEPSIVAGVSGAAKLIAQSGGFASEADEPIMIGQIQVVDVTQTAHAQAVLLAHREEILNLANSLHPNMVARGGGAKDLELVVHPSATHRGDMLVVHLLVDTRDAMGANLVNSMCEGVASLIERLTGGKVFLRILSNLTDRAMVRSRCVIRTGDLAGKGYGGEDVRDGVILANEFAAIDPYRATTHNKGIMNGIDAVAIATGNDFRAIEAAAHAYAGRGHAYTSLTRWYKDDVGNLIGVLEVPLKVGTVGGSLQSNPMVGLCNRLLGVESARELAGVMGAVGLAQNFAALRALVTEGIQAGHMGLHARSVAATAGATPEIFEQVVEALIESGDIKVWKAQAIIEKLKHKIAPRHPSGDPEMSAGFGKVILLGEHSVVYGRHAIAAPIPLAIEAKVDSAEDGVLLQIPRWGVEERLQHGHRYRHSIHEAVNLVLEKLGLHNENMRIVVHPHVPRAMGLGGSAALAVAIIRALIKHFRIDLSADAISELAFASEKVVHGSASGIDNTIATYGQFLLFKKGDPPLRQVLAVPQPLPMVIGITGVEGLTAKTVGKVRAAFERNEDLYNDIFNKMDALVMRAVEAITRYDLPLLGELMNLNQGFLNGLGVSSRELEALIDIAREHGAVGAKLTGGGGGGSIVALCPDTQEQVVEAMERAGYRALAVNIG